MFADLNFLFNSDFRIHTVGVAQVVEPQVVALVVVGSSPITHPIYKPLTGQENCPVICFRLNFIYLIENKYNSELSQEPDSVF